MLSVPAIPDRDSTGGGQSLLPPAPWLGSLLGLFRAGLGTPSRSALSTPLAPVSCFRQFVDVACALAVFDGSFRTSSVVAWAEGLLAAVTTSPGARLSLSGDGDNRRFNVVSAGEPASGVGVPWSDSTSMASGLEFLTEDLTAGEEAGVVGLAFG